ncbi:hypothetical protein HGA91_04980 [candidate division WWE3 bacterium]|nr:hypothetical protein [candidate division WWE3 bacterium]
MKLNYRTAAIFGVFLVSILILSIGILLKLTPQDKATLNTVNITTFTRTYDAYTKPNLDLVSITPTPLPGGKPWWLQSSDQPINDTVAFGRNLGTMIFDIRSKSDFDADHLSGAFSLPFDVIVSGTYSIPLSAEVIMYGDRITSDQKNIISEALFSKGIRSAQIIDSSYSELTSILPHEPTKETFKEDDTHE